MSKQPDNKHGNGTHVQRVTISGCGSELQGVGRLRDGRAVFVPGALPGEVVDIEITRDAGRFCEARLLSVIKASPERAQVNCRYAPRCGGCVARHMSYTATLRLKRQRVIDALERIGGIAEPVVYDTLGCATPERYRNKAEFAVEIRNNEIRIGCQEAHSHSVLPIDDCLLQKRVSIRALNWFSAHLAEYGCASRIRNLVTRINRAGQLCVVISYDAQPGMITTGCGSDNKTSRASRSPGGSRSGGRPGLHSSDDQALLDELRTLADALSRDFPELASVHCCELTPLPAHALDGRCKLLWGSETFSDTLLGLDFELSPQAFMQVNPEQAEVLYKQVLSAVGLSDKMNDIQGTPSGAMARSTETVSERDAPRQNEPSRTPRILDAYCGVGTITLAAAARGGDCVGVEIIAPAVENARRNAQRNGLARHARFICGDATREVTRLIARGERFDAAILDPPRRGADAALLHALAEAQIPRIAYVSCNPATFARDVRILCEDGYTLRYAQPVDMFPWTAHVETCALLNRKSCDGHRDR